MTVCNLMNLGCNVIFLRAVALVAAMCTVIVAGVAVLPASADTEQQGIVATNPLDTTPHVLDGTVHAVAVVGDVVVVGGEFTQVREAATGSPTLSRTNLFAFSHATGKIDVNFRPQVDGGVLSLEAGPDETVYVGGLFNTVNGATRKRLARLNVADGAPTAAFTRSQINWGNVTTITLRRSHLYIGGRFDTVTDTQTGTQRHVLARLDAGTGAVDPNFNVAVSDPRSGELVVKELAVDPDETKLVIDGTFTKVNGEARSQIAVIDVSGTPALSTWATASYTASCEAGYDTYMRQIDFSPDGSYFVVVTAGGYVASTLCSTAARWESNRSGSGQEPTWVNYTGGDSLLSVSVTGAAVYVGGHQRWMDNPQGNNDAGPGAVPRQGIAAIDPTSGKSADIDWNPTRTLGHGAEALTATSTGLLVGSDTDQLGGEYHGRIGEFPLSGIPGAPREVTATAGDGQATVSWTPPSSPGGTITKYQVASTPAGGIAEAPGDQHSAVVTGLINGQSYTFTVEAVNAAGTGPASDPSNAVTPQAAGAPHADFTIACDDGASSCDFDASTSTDPDGTISTYQWDFGDGSEGEGQRVTHKYSTGGNYPVMLRVIDDADLNSETVKTVTLNLNPTAAIKVTCVNSTRACTFDASGSQDADGTIASYKWDFGDGATGSGGAVTHTYPSTGAYAVRLTVTDDKGATGTANRILTVSSTNTSPTAGFTAGCTDSIRWCSFDASASQDPDGSISTYTWDFGDGITGTGMYAQHTYTAPGTYTVELTTIDDKGATGTASKQITVGSTGTNKPPLARFSYICPGLLHCEFDAAGSSDEDGTITTYAWSFGDGANGTGSTPMHDYTTKGTYTVTLTVTDDKGAKTSTTKQVTPR
jgi:PKD repeat protein